MCIVCVSRTMGRKRPIPRLRLSAPNSSHILKTASAQLLITIRTSASKLVFAAARGSPRPTLPSHTAAIRVGIQDLKAKHLQIF